jgi:hypothetical protein
LHGAITEKQVGRLIRVVAVAGEVEAGGVVAAWLDAERVGRFSCQKILQNF